MGRTIVDIDVRDVEKRKIPSKHYVYVIYVTWSDSSTNVIYRRYSRFFDFQSDIMDMFPEEAGTLDPEKRIIPFLPGKKFFGRSHIREVAVKRLGPIADYCKQLMQLPRKISECKEVIEFFELEPEDINPPKGKKASIKAKKISNPKPLEVFIAVTDYKKQEKGEISLRVGDVVEVVEKTETGWWFVNVEEEQGWVPSTCLEREDGTKEESTVIFQPGEEEQYLCTEEFKGQGNDEISLERGAVVDVMEKNLEGWWRVRYNGREGYAPATYLMKCEGFKIRRPKPKTPVQQTVSTISTGPQIVKSLHEVSDLLNEEPGASVTRGADNVSHTDDEFDDNYELPDEEKIYSINELSKILKEDKRGSEETDKVYESINALKSRSLKRRGSTRPPPRPTVKPKTQKRSGVSNSPVLQRNESVSKDYVTICDFSNHVGDGISFTAGQHVKVLEKNETGWWYIEFDGHEGWAPASYIESCGQTTTKLTVTENNSRPKSPVPTSPVPKPSLSKSREDVSDTNNDRATSPKRSSAMPSAGDLASALKSKLKPKGPPKPPKKDFLDDDSTELDKSQDDMKDSRVVSGVTSKPGVNTKPTRSMLSAPPPPPPAGKTALGGKVSNAGGDSGVNKGPITPAKPKPSAQSDINKKVSVTSAVISNTNNDEDDSQAGKLNVAGLAGALKARFEGQNNDKDKPDTPSIGQKPKPDVPSPGHKPKFDVPKPVLKPVQKKPDVPAATNKPKDTSKPLPFNKPSPGSKPSVPSNSSKPTVSSNNKPSWVKPNNETTNSDKPSWVKPSNDSNSSNKPSWVKPNNETATSDKPSWVKPSNNTTNNDKPSWMTPNKETTSSDKPSWAKPNKDSPSTSKPSWVKSDNVTKSGDSSPQEGAAPKVSDLASVLKAKFENRTSNSAETNVQNSSPNPPSKPKLTDKPLNKPTRPQTPPVSQAKPAGTPPKPPSKPGTASPGRSSSPLNVDKNVDMRKIDPNKYSERPLPPKPAIGKKKEGDVNNLHDTKPLPAVPNKPKGPTRTKSSDTNSDSDDESKPVGVSGLANALKAKLGGAKGSETPAKSVPVKPGKPKISDNKPSNQNGSAGVSSNMNTDKENNNSHGTTNKDNMYRAIADHVASNSGEISLTVGLEVELLEKAEGWWYVCTDSAEGWAPEAYLEKIVNKVSGNVKQAAGGKTPKPKKPVFRTCSDFEAEHEGELSVPRGQEVTVVDQDDGGWWFVNVDGKEGWVPAAYLQQV